MLSGFTAVLYNKVNRFYRARFDNRRLDYVNTWDIPEYTLQHFHIWWHAYLFHLHWKEGLFSSIFPPARCHPPWEFTVCASRKKCAAFLSASPQGEGVWFYRGFSSACPVRCCRTLKLDVSENCSYSEASVPFPLTQKTRERFCCWDQKNDEIPTALK